MRLKIWLRNHMESYGSFQVQTVLLSPTVGGGQHGSSTTTELVEVMLSRPQQRVPSVRADPS